MAKPVGRSEWELDEAEAAALVAGTHGDPFARLGLQEQQWAMDRALRDPRRGRA